MSRDKLKFSNDAGSPPQGNAKPHALAICAESIAGALAGFCQGAYPALLEN